MRASVIRPRAQVEAIDAERTAERRLGAAATLALGGGEGGSGAGLPLCESAKLKALLEVLTERIPQGERRPSSK